MNRNRLAICFLFFTLTLPGCGSPDSPTVSQVLEFTERAESDLERLSVEAEYASWVQSNFITYDTDRQAATTLQRVMAATAVLAKEAARFDQLELPEDVARKLDLIKLSLPLTAPSNEAEQLELTQLATAMASLYGKGQYCRENGECLDLTTMSTIMAESRQAGLLAELWTGWRTISPPLRSQYKRFAELANAGARELGFADLGALWRSNYDLPPDDFAAELDRLWNQVRPLYEALHCHVRARLAEFYGADEVPLDQPIPAHLLGNMWSQQWANIFDLVAPSDAGDRGYDLTTLLRQKNLDAQEMVRYGERFFTSLGFAPLPDTFWERSLFTKPQDRDVVCHASAWDIDGQEDLRIKMCIGINADDFSTIHHELGHNFYQRAYNQQPFLFKGGANGGFHEGIGDTIALSITPEYLNQIELLQRVPDASADLGLLLRMALDKVAFLPFGLLVDRWRWKVFSGEVDESDYNKAWWELRTSYQGIEPPVARSESDFDPGAKYHVPSNTSYSRYFVAHILQFQFHKALCEAAGYEGPLHRCSIYGSREAGAKLTDMLELGTSQPWPVPLEKLTGTREMDASAILDYFQPLQTWLAEQNQGRACGW